MHPIAVKVTSAILGGVTAHLLLQAYWLTPVGYLVPLITRSNGQMLEAFFGHHLSAETLFLGLVMLAKVLPAACLLGGVCAWGLARRGSTRGFVYGGLFYLLASHFLQWVWVIQPLEEAMGSAQEYLREKYLDWAIVKAVAFSVFITALHLVAALIRRGELQRPVGQPAADL